MLADNTLRPFNREIEFNPVKGIFDEDWIMNEKEFLRKFLDSMYERFWPEYKKHEQFDIRFEISASEFLEKHHKEFEEVVFLKKQSGQNE